MATKAEGAADAAAKVDTILSVPRAGGLYPAIRGGGDAYRKGSTVRIEADGVTYTGKVADLSDGELGPLVHLDDLTPETPAA